MHADRVDALDDRGRDVTSEGFAKLIAAVCTWLQPWTNQQHEEDPSAVQTAVAQQVFTGGPPRKRCCAVVRRRATPAPRGSWSASAGRLAMRSR